MERILIIVAHPDDEVLGMGGTIAKYALAGAEIALLIVTDGSSAQYQGNKDVAAIIEKKKKETEDCASVLGIQYIYYGGLPDMKLDATPHIQVNAAIEKVISEFKPNIVYTHFYGDVNKDHQCVYESTLVACRPVVGQTVKKLFLYSVPSSTEWNVQTAHCAFMPNWYEDISGVYAEKKYKGFAHYETELREYPHPRSIEYLRQMDIAEGLRVGLGAAESFMLLRNLT